jgi:hypothetical protein
MLSYVYGFSLMTDDSERELITFHWNRERDVFALIPNGHVHIGPALLEEPTTVRSGDFHNAHVPTDQLPFSTVVRFAIVELGVVPQVRDWRSILARSEALAREPIEP